MNFQSHKSNKSKSIIIIDDSQADIFLATRLFELLNAENRIQTFNNAIQALEYFRLIENVPAYYNLFTPEIILLDINMPIMDGFEFLAEFDKFKLFKNKPLEILVTSPTCNAQEMEQVKKYGKRCSFILKPLNIKALRNFTKDLI